MIQGRALVLNKHWVPIATISARQALVLICRETAQVICPETYEICGLDRWIERSLDEPDRAGSIRTPNLMLHKPEVILLSKFSGVPRRHISFTRRNLYRRDRHTCQYCRERPPAGKLTIDHVLPRSRGGPSSWENCVLACVSCNTRKADRTPREAGFELDREPTKPAWSPLAELETATVPDAWGAFLKTRAAV